MTKELDTKLEQLKTLEDHIQKLSTERDAFRKELFALLEKENVERYKNDFVTISQVERKTIKYSKPVEEILAHLESQNLTKYIEVVPEHRQLSKEFDKDLKDGNIMFAGVEVESKSFPSIRFV